MTIQNKIIKHTKFIYEYVGAATVEECNKIQSLIVTSPMYNTHLETSSPRTKVRNNTCINISHLAGIGSNLQEADNITHKIFSKVHLDYVTNNPNYFCLKDAEHLYQLTCSYTYRTYDENDYYDWHIDSSEQEQLVFSYILYLNDDFTGGDTLFLHQKVKVNPKIGNMLGFPCDMQTVHKSTPIKKGRKDIIWTCMEYSP